MIISKQECEGAAEELGLTDKSASSSQSNGKPHGCIYSKSPQKLTFELPVGHPYGDTPCGAMSNGIMYECICAKEGNVAFIFKHKILLLQHNGGFFSVLIKHQFPYFRSVQKQRGLPTK